MVAALSGTGVGNDSAIGNLLRLLADLRNQRWPVAFTNLASENAWTTATPDVLVDLRTTIGRGQIDYKSQLKDILGKGATTLFVHEAGLKNWGENTGLVVLGSRLDIPDAWIAAEQQLTHAKTGTVSALAIGISPGSSQDVPLQDAMQK
jgi:hypothetical protein